jgi:hypothetical protein
VDGGSGPCPPKGELRKIQYLIMLIHLESLLYI